MNLNLTIIRDYLPAEYHTQLYGPVQDKLVCPRPLLYTPCSKLAADKLYILSDVIPKTLRPDPDCSFIFVRSQVPVSWADSGVSILQIKNISDFYQVSILSAKFLIFLINGKIFLEMNWKNR